MRVGLGGLLLAAGLGGLGWYASQGPAKQIEEQIAIAAAGVAGTAEHDVSAVVSGRDITVTGTVEDAEEQAELLAAFDALPGRRVVNIDGLSTLPVVAPYVASLEKTEGGVAVSGFAPSAAVKDALGFEALEIANGEPDAWAEAVQAVSAALDTLKSGTADMSDTTVTLAGLAANPDARAAFDTAIADLPDGYTVESDIALEDDGTPLRLSLNYDGENLTGTGKIPTDVESASIAIDGSTAALDLTEATSASEDGQWSAVVAAGLNALGTLREGQLSLEGQTLTLTGTGSPDALAAAEDALRALPDGYTAAPALEIYDDGTPLRLILQYDGEALSGTGKIPTDFNASDVTVGGAATDLDLLQADIPAEDPTWPAFAAAALDALGALNEGQMALEGRSVILNGVGTPDGIAAAEAALDAAPEGYMKMTDFTVFDDGMPFTLTVEKTVDGLKANGKVPADFDTALDGVETAFITDESGLWPGIGEAGLAALDKLQTGTLTIEGDTVTLTGVAFSQDEQTAALDALANVASETDVAISEEGQVQPLVVTYDADVGATISGSLPDGVTSDTVADALSVLVSEGNVSAIPLETDADILGVLANVQPFLPELNGFTATETGTQATLDAVAAPGVAPVPLADAIQSAIGEATALTVAAPAELPTEGALRRNIFTGQQEVFTAGYWLPSFDFFPTPESCAEQSAAVLERDQVRFVSGSAELDVQSIRAINALSALARKCATEGGVFLQVAGHTDNTGDAEANLALSQARADAVRDAILDRGLARVVVSAVGYGDTQPIADNETEEGRAENRRTEFNWNFE